jgi:hypothetical protein
LAYLQFKRLVDSKVAAILYAQAGPTPAESDDIAVEDFAD